MEDQYTLKTRHSFQLLFILWAPASPNENSLGVNVGTIWCIEWRQRLRSDQTRNELHDFGVSQVGDRNPSHERNLIARRSDSKQGRCVSTFTELDSWACRLETCAFSNWAIVSVPPVTQGVPWPDDPQLELVTALAACVWNWCRSVCLTLSWLT